MFSHLAFGVNDAASSRVYAACAWCETAFRLQASKHDRLLWPHRARSQQQNVTGYFCTFLILLLWPHGMRIATNLNVTWSCFGRCQKKKKIKREYRRVFGVAGPLSQFKAHCFASVPFYWKTSHICDFASRKVLGVGHSGQNTSSQYVRVSKFAKQHSAWCVLAMNSCHFILQHSHETHLRCHQRCLRKEMALSLRKQFFHESLFTTGRSRLIRIWIIGISVLIRKKKNIYMRKCPISPV